MVNYANSKIYQIVSNTTGRRYIGCTTSTLSSKLAQERIAYKKGIPSLVRQIFDDGQVCVILIENCPCSSKEELLRRHRHLIENMDCVNLQPVKQQVVWHNNEHREQLKQCKVLPQSPTHSVASITVEYDDIYQTNEST